MSCSGLALWQKILEKLTRLSELINLYSFDGKNTIDPVKGGNWVPFVLFFTKKIFKYGFLMKNISINISVFFTKKIFKYGFSMKNISINEF